jgi:hypothetical protein
MFPRERTVPEETILLSLRERQGEGRREVAVRQSESLSELTRSAKVVLRVVDSVIRVRAIQIPSPKPEVSPKRLGFVGFQ